MGKTAILVDGGFFLKRIEKILGTATPEVRANQLITYATRHLLEHHNQIHHDLYRIFYYDCPPLDGNIYHPLLKKNINLKKTSQYEWMTGFIKALYSKRKVAVRLGKLSKESHYTIKYDSLKKLMNQAITLSELQESDFYNDTKQKGVDMRIGIDIASLSFKKQVEQIVLIAGDSDFVPAAKLARREGIDFILDPLNQAISSDLFEHIDGKRTCLSKEEIASKMLIKKQ